MTEVITSAFTGTARTMPPVTLGYVSISNEGKIHLLQFIEVIEAIGKLIEGGFGVRYLVSADYRRKVNERCREMSKGEIIFYAFETIIGIVFLSIIIYVVSTILIDCAK